MIITEKFSSSTGDGEKKNFVSGASKPIHTHTQSIFTVINIISVSYYRMISGQLWSSWCTGNVSCIVISAPAAA